MNTNLRAAGRAPRGEPAPLQPLPLQARVVPAPAPHAAFAQPRKFTPRQSEILILLCEGLPNKLIARRLEISTATVKVHMTQVFRKLGVTCRLQAVLAARRYRLLDLHGDGPQRS